MDITPPHFYSDACTTELEIQVCPAALLERTRRERSPQILAETTTLTVWERRALFPYLFQLASIQFRSMGGWLGHFSEHKCTIIESLGHVPWDTVDNPFWDKLVGFVAQDWIAARLHLQDRPFHASWSRLLLIMLRALESPP